MSSDSNTAARPISDLISESNMTAPSDYVVDGVQPEHAVKPSSVDELAELVRSARAERISAIPWGGGSQMGVGNIPSSYGVALDLTDLNEVLRYDPDDMTMSVQCGCRLQDLNAMLGEHRQVLPVDAAFPEQATIGGLTAVGASGPRRLGYGPLRDLIIGISVMSVDGVVTKAGGNVVKNVTGFDMMRLHHGGLGSLGIILSVNLKVIPKPQTERTVIAAYQTLEAADEAARNVVQSQLGVTAMVALNPSASTEAVDLEDHLWTVVVRCEAPPSAVVRQAERVSAFVREGAESVTVEDSTEGSAARWEQICRALDQRPDSPDMSIRLGCSASRMRDVGEALAANLESIPDSRLTLDYGSGLCYVRIGRSAAPAGGHARLYAGVAERGDHATLMTGPLELKRAIDVFGERGPGFSVVESLKSTFDPEGVLNRGRAAGRL
jgi:glycolate oxidase FAD binding subunit